MKAATVTGLFAAGAAEAAPPALLEGLGKIGASGIGAETVSGAAIGTASKGAATAPIARPRPIATVRACAAGAPAPPRVPSRWSLMWPICG